MNENTRDGIIAKLAAAGTVRMLSGQLVVEDEDLAGIVKASLFGDHDELNAAVFEEATTMELDLAFGSSSFDVSVPKIGEKVVKIDYREFTDESLSALNNLVQMLAKYPDCRTAWREEYPKRLTRKDLQRFYDRGSFHAIHMRPNPRHPASGLYPYISVVDVMHHNYTIHGRDVDDLMDQISKPDHPVIASYKSLDELVEDGWRLD